MLDMYGNNFYFVPFFLFNFSMLLIMDHNPLVFFGWEGSQFGNSGGRPLVRLQSIGCRLVNTRPAKPLRGRGSKWSVFVWVYYGIFFSFVSKKKFWVFASENNFVLGHPWKLHVFSPSPTPFGPLFLRVCFQFWFWWEKEDWGPSSWVPGQGSYWVPVCAEFYTREAQECPPVSWS